MSLELNGDGGGTQHSHCRLLPFFPYFIIYYLSFSSSPSFASFLLLLMCYNNNENHHGKIRNLVSLLLLSYITMHTNENNQGAKIVSLQQ
jgi:hypothetical protein